jgi:hypothetical protein
VVSEATARARDLWLARIDDAGLAGRFSIPFYGLFSLEGKPSFGPCTDFVQRCLKGSSLFGELVFDANRAFRNDSPYHELFRLERAEPLGQHSVRDIRDGAPDERVSRFSLEERLDDRACPPATDELDGTVETGANLVGRVRRNHEKKVGNESA